MLRQRKKDRENEKVSELNNGVHGLSSIKKRLDKELNTDVKFNYKNNLNGRKISDVVSEMIQPLMEEARTFKEEQNIVGLGVMAWNLGVIKKKNGEKEMQKALKGFGMKLPKEIKSILLEYSEVKCENYSEYNEFILDYELTRLNSHQNNLTVSYKSVNE
ncbi:MAG: hypothetical protein U9R42_06295 [Bacteroidota bacterium]|nr:hypothetical protein [Bacteroidota bacterium]